MNKWLLTFLKWWLFHRIQLSTRIFPWFLKWLNIVAIVTECALFSNRPRWSNVCRWLLHALIVGSMNSFSLLFFISLATWVKVSTTATICIPGWFLPACLPIVVDAWLTCGTRWFSIRWTHIDTWWSSWAYFKYMLIHCNCWFCYNNCVYALDLRIALVGPLVWLDSPYSCFLPAY